MLEVKMELDLQQDKLRNAQVVTQLKNSGVAVTDEWIHRNLMQIPDSEKMEFELMTERATRAAFQLNIESLAKQAFAMFAPPPPPLGVAPEAPPGGQAAPESQGMASEPPAQATTIPGGPAAAAAGGGAIPQTEPRPPGQEQGY